MHTKVLAKNGQAGFSLIELLVVVGIIGILAAVAVPQYTKYNARSKAGAALSLVRNIETAQEARIATDQQPLNVSTDLNLLMGRPTAAPAGFAAPTGTAPGNFVWTVAMASTSATSLGSCQGAVINITASNTAGKIPTGGPYSTELTEDFHVRTYPPACHPTRPAAAAAA